MLNVKFPLLDHWTFLRQVNANRYAELFTAAGLDRTLVLPEAKPGLRHVWNQYVVRVPDGLRNPLREALSEARVGTEVYYPLGLHQQDCFRYLGYQPDDLPQTRRAAEEVLALPIFPELRAEEQKFVVERIAAFFAQRRRAHPGSTAQVPCPPGGIRRGKEPGLEIISKRRRSVDFSPRTAENAEAAWAKAHATIAGRGS